MATISKADLVAALAEKTGTTKAIAGELIDALSAVIAEKVAAGDVVTLPGIAKIQAKDTAERSVRNPRTGETSVKAAGRSVKIAAVKALKDAVAV